MLTDDDKPWFVNQVASHIAAGEQRMSARLEERITAVEERMSARIEKTETALLTEFHKWASPVAEMEAWTDRVKKARGRQLHSAYKPFKSSCV